MTAVIGILNKNGMTMAADSAVTVTGGNSKKIYNTANKIFLKQEHGVIQDIQKQLALSDEVATALKSLKTVKGKYSEALVLTTSSSGVIRLVPNPFLYWVASSESRDNDYLKELQKENGGNLLEAIKQCAKEYPYGIR